MLRLRPFRKNDAKYIVGWTTEEEEFLKWNAGLFGEFPLTEERLLAALAGRDDNEGYFPFVAFDESGPVGFFNLRVPGDTNEEIRFGFVIVDPKIRGKGYGKKMLELGLKYAFEIYGAKHAELGVFDNNEAAYQCYKSLGFRENGVEECYEVFGRKWNCIELELMANV